MRGPRLGVACVVGCLAACGSSNDETPTAKDVCAAAVVSVSGRVLDCTGDGVMAKAQTTAFESRYRCRNDLNGVSVVDAYRCPQEIDALSCVTVTEATSMPAMWLVNTSVCPLLFMDVTGDTE
jgi:hypothetical protein